MKKMEISKIQIKNFATIAELDIEFAKGLNIITGEQEEANPYSLQP